MVGGSRSCYRIPNTRLQIQFLISFKEQEVRCSFVQSARAQAHTGDWKPDISYLNELPRASHFSPLILVFVRDLDASVALVVLGGRGLAGISLSWYEIYLYIL